MHTLNTILDETLLQIIGHLEGQLATIAKLALTCRKVGAVATEVKGLAMLHCTGFWIYPAGVLLRILLYDDLSRT